MRVALRIAALVATLHFGIAFTGATYASLHSAGGNSAQQLGSVVGLLLLGTLCLYGVVQLWRLRRIGLVVVGAMYALILTMQVVGLLQQHNSWISVLLIAAMLALLWCPLAWRACTLKPPARLDGHVTPGQSL